MSTGDSSYCSLSVALPFSRYWVHLRRKKIHLEIEMFIYTVHYAAFVGITKLGLIRITKLCFILELTNANHSFLYNFFGYWISKNHSVETSFTVMGGSEISVISRQRVTSRHIFKYAAKHSVPFFRAFSHGRTDMAMACRLTRERRFPKRNIHNKLHSTRYSYKHSYCSIFRKGNS